MLYVTLLANKNPELHLERLIIGARCNIEIIGVGATPGRDRPEKLTEPCYSLKSKNVDFR